MLIYEIISLAPTFFETSKSILPANIFILVLNSSSVKFVFSVETEFKDF